MPKAGDIIYPTTNLDPTMQSIRRRNVMALIIPGYNEEMVISSTIKSAIKAGQNKAHIYVVSDGSTDATCAIAARLLGKSHVLQVEHGGKAGALKKAIDYFQLTERYAWIHIADADGVFGPGYFKAFRLGLRKGNCVAATGHIQSLKGGWVSKYRTYEYTLGLEIVRRIQSWFGVITVIPGPTSCFASELIDQLNFDTGTLTEDFDITLQIHRNKLGSIRYIPEAKTFTQDPRNFSDYLHQIRRWYRGYWQSVRGHGVGLHPQKIDVYLSALTLETFFYAAQLIIVPILAIILRAPQLVAVMFIADLLVFLSLTILAAMVNNRYDILAAFPLFYLTRFANMIVFIQSFLDVIVFNRFKQTLPGWETAGRRYANAN